jgi:hypothetical protein
MDHNDNINTKKFNYYPTYDYHLNNLLLQQHPQLYNDNSLNPPSTLTDITHFHTSRDSS